MWLDIRLSQNTLILLGSRNESAGSVLHGVVHLNLKRETCIDFVSLKLKGKAETFWPSAFVANPLANYERQNLVLYTWDLLPAKDGPFTLPPGEHQYPFEFVFNGFLPESVQIKNGQVKYKLVAALGRGLLKPNLICERELKVCRFAQPSVFNTTYPIVDTWENMLDYTIFISHQVISLFDSLSVFLTFLPKNPEVRVKGITFELMENLTLRQTKSGKSQVDTRWYTLNSKLEETRFSYSRSYAVTFPPTEKIHFDCSTELIEISHKLQARVTFSAGKTVNAIVIKVPLSIMAASLETMSENPPRYDQIPLPASCHSELLPVHFSDPLPPPYH
ncbi:hypothetical protein K493DRAFT_364579 [Basidiobolus meristosporus CBS 931.73]|uniref:Arrestin C-terminal-like domain-containing protein n=1 Tax=Basidiobolus meristosporus CBS 931.73 TaxID=1314790 RepID=A0A1Y1VYQ2_9FUNG|nr:hypothetical protein K493DRAFT_364579 [Basidiobolus meristosporus CBS 931.73]|eukprot:ORX66397.1 hypothetical protein K493DRAFT_364579 [Basidiobolus meristosporus CBS 931.73]